MCTCKHLPILKRPFRLLVLVLTVFLFINVSAFSLVAQGASYGSSTSPLKVYSGGAAVGGSYGTFQSRTVISGSTYGSTAKGYIRDYHPGDNTIYVSLTKTISARSSTTSSVTSQRYNDGRWTAYPQISTFHSSSVSKVDLYVCEDVRFWFDPCSSAKRVYTK